MKNIDWKNVLKLIMAILAAILGTLGASSCFDSI